MPKINTLIQIIAPIIAIIVIALNFSKIRASKQARVAGLIILSIAVIGMLVVLIAAIK
jgi:hypothetical protein